MLADTPLIGAARRGRAADVVALLADGADVNERMTSGTTALLIACENGHDEVVTTLLAANADVNRSPPPRGTKPSETTKSRRTPRDEETRSQPSRRICAAA